MWWLGVIVQLEGCPIKDALVAYPVTPREAPGVSSTPTQLRPAFFWDSEMSCWCSIWQSPQASEADVQKCFNSHFKKYMGLPKCARVGGVVPHVQAVGTDYISSETPSPFAVSPDHNVPSAAEATPSEPRVPGMKTLPPLADMPPSAPPLPPLQNMGSFTSRPIANLGNIAHVPGEPPQKKRHTVTWGGLSATDVAAAGSAPKATAVGEPATVLRSHSGSISATHQPSTVRREVGSLEATRSDAKFMCAGEKAPVLVDSGMPALHGGHWKSGMGAHLRAIGQHGLSSAWSQPLIADQQPLQALHANTAGAGAPVSCSHSRAEFKRQVSRAQLIRSSSSCRGVPGSVQLAAALRAAPDCSSPHAMESAATAAMQVHDGCRDSGGSGSAVCGSSDLSGICTAERSAAGRVGLWDDAAAAAAAEMCANGRWDLLRGGNGVFERNVNFKCLVNAAAQMPVQGYSIPPTAAAVMQGREQCNQGLRARAQTGELGTADSLRLLADVREQEDAAVGLLCLRHHPDGLGGGGPWH